MQFDSVSHIPSKIIVSDVISSRYPGGVRPESWDDRTDGEDVIKTEGGQTLKLHSDGGQSPPKKGWVVMLTDGNSSKGYKWTLYGIKQLTH